MNKNQPPQDVILTDYFYDDEADQFSFFRIPRLLITSQRFKGLSIEAKLLYGLMLDRMGLSRKNDWQDKNGRIYIFYRIEPPKEKKQKEKEPSSICEDLNCAHVKAINLLKELEAVNLIERKRQGQGKPTIFYVKKFTIGKVDPNLEDISDNEEVLTSQNRNSRNIKSISQEVSDADFLKYQNDTSRSIKNRPLEVSKPECSYTKNSYTEFSHTESVNPSIQPSTENLARARAEGDGRMDGRAERERIKKQIEYELLPYRDLTPWQLRQADELLELMVEIALTQSPSIQIGQGSYPADYVKERFAKIRVEHIEQVLIGLRENEGRVVNVRAYMLASLFNATASLESAYGLSAAYG